jgi:hypothetical protein
VKEAFDEIQNNRSIGEIPPENPYVFAKAHSLSAIQSDFGKGLRAYANACGLGYIRHITARSLRRYWGSQVPY